MEQGHWCAEGRKNTEGGDANPAADPEVVLPNNQDRDNPFVIPETEDEGRDDLCYEGNASSIPASNKLL